MESENVSGLEVIKGGGVGPNVNMKSSEIYSHSYSFS
jgi:hypothetical protein